MIKTIDDFLNDLELNFLTNYAKQNIDLYTLKKLGNAFINFNCKSGNTSDMKSILGVQWFSILIKIKKTLKDIINSDLLLYSTKISVTTDNYIIQKHLDDNVHGKSLDKSYTCIIYITKNWEESMGGLWNGGDEYIVPYYNRLILYSRDIEHSVTPSLSTWSDNRTILLTSWCNY
jgi:hypothetical protein